MQHTYHHDHTFLLNEAYSTKNVTLQLPATHIPFERRQHTQFIQTDKCVCSFSVPNLCQVPCGTAPRHEDLCKLDTPPRTWYCMYHIYFLHAISSVRGKEFLPLP